MLQGKIYCTYMTTVAINGFGRIGRLFLRQASKNKKLKIVAINDLGDIENLAYLFEYDSVYGRFGGSIKVQGNSIVIDGKKVQVLQEKDPSKLPWKKLGVDIVIEATGVFNSYKKAEIHRKAGAKRVVITAPSKDEDTKDGKTVLMGVNEKEASSCSLTSNGSCTTNAVAAVVQVLDEAIGVEKAILTTTHGYTASQKLVDGPSNRSDVRRGRAAAQNIIPSTTGAAKTVGRAMPKFKDNFDGMALRVPVIAGSIADVTLVTKKKTTEKEVNSAFEKAAKLPRWKGILTTTTDPIVSTDIIGEPYGSIVDLNFTKVVDGDLVKVLSWYDNEWGYVTTLIKHVETVANSVK